jgi:superfamily II DNA/RNA helicase
VVLSPAKNKLDTLTDLLSRIGNEPGIIFCNFKETIQFVSDHLTDKNIAHGCFFGGMEQMERERVLIKFRNGTHRLIVATDLAARGLDIPEIKFIIHFQLPLKAHEFTHRNGRTARMKSNGTAYVLKWEEDNLPDYLETLDPETVWCNELGKPKNYEPQLWETLFVSGGRKDKISKGDIAGLFLKQGNLNPDQLGQIELKTDCAFVGVKSANVDKLIQQLDNSRLKKKKVRITKL